MSPIEKMPYWIECCCAQLTLEPDEILVLEEVLQKALRDAYLAGRRTQYRTY